MTNTIVHIVGATASLILFLGANQANAATTTFTNESNFINAAGGLRLESFETFSTTVASTDPIVTSFFAVSIVGDEFANMHIEDLGPEGETATDGTKFLLAGDTNGRRVFNANLYFYTADF